MTTPTERQFAIFRRGEVRELMLANYREGLRALLNPETNQPFTEDTIRQVTQVGSRFYVDFDAVDLTMQGGQKRSEFFAQQARIDRAGHSYLHGFHGTQWGEQALPGFGGSGAVLAAGNLGTTWIGSTTVPDATATTATDPAGNRYQVLITATETGGGTTVQMGGIDAGEATNIEVGTVLTWTNPPPGSTATASVTGDDFSGGAAPENDDDFSERLAARVRHKPAAGNAAQFRAWARESSVSVEDAFIYPCARGAGSVLVVPTQKRGLATGPLARIPSVGVLSAVTAYLVAPASPVVPPRAMVIVVPPVAESSDVTLELSQLKGSATGWTDVNPFPAVNAGGTSVAVDSVTSPTLFSISAAAAGQLPQGAVGPLGGVSLMRWVPASSSFEALDVDTVTDDGGGIYTVALSTAPAEAIAIGTIISPDMASRDLLAAGTTAYFDSLGPGEVLDLGTSTLGARAFRQPKPTEVFPARAGQSMIATISEALGSAVANATVSGLTVTLPALPSDPIDGPSMVVLGELGVYSLD